MTKDRELLVLAAKAAGIDAGWHCPEDEIEDQADDLAKSEGMWLKGARSPDNSKYWNPLIDDGDAFRLAVKLGMHMSPDLCGQSYANNTFETINANMGNTYASLRRAIVRDAAKKDAPADRDVMAEALATLRTEVEALHNVSNYDVWFKNQVLALIDKTGGKV